MRDKLEFSAAGVKLDRASAAARQPGAGVSRSIAAPEAIHFHVFSLIWAGIFSRCCFFPAVAVLLLGASVAVGESTETTNDAARFFQRGESICRDVEQITGFTFTNKVKMAVQSPEDFQNYMKEAIDREYGKDGLEDYARSLVKVGVLERLVNLSETIMGLLSSQVLAHYDPKSKTFFLLQTNMPSAFMDPTAAHELFHALQDQRHDLYKFMEEDIAKLRDNSDAASAKQWLVEGEAMYVMALWMVRETAGKKDSETADFLVVMALKAEASMDYEKLVDLASTQFGGNEADPMVASIKDMKDAPRFLVEPLIAAYLKGAVLVDHVKSKGGWKAVDDLFDHPPLSTEQAMHPEKIGGPDVPVDVRLPDLAGKLPAGWRKAGEDVMGEMGVKMFFEIWQKNEAKDVLAAESAAAGWGGDRYYYFENKDSGKDLLVWQTVWDTTGDASEFSVAYRMTLPVRFPEFKKTTRSDEKSAWKYQVWEIQPGRFLKLVIDGKTVGIVDTTDRALLDVMWP
jgi:hypothetical protein